MSSDEKRSHKRQIVHYPVRVACGEGRGFDGAIENLGALGALVTTPELEPSVEVGARITLSIELPEGGTVKVGGEVLRVDQEFSGGEVRRTLAVRFDEEIHA